MKINFFKPSFLFDQLEVITYLENHSYTSINLVQKITKDKVPICNMSVCLVWVDGNKKKPSRIPSNIISRFKLMEVV